MRCQDTIPRQTDRANSDKCAKLFQAISVDDGVGVVDSLVAVRFMPSMSIGLENLLLVAFCQLEVVAKIGIVLSSSPSPGPINTAFDTSIEFFSNNLSGTFGRLPRPPPEVDSQVASGN